MNDTIIHQPMEYGDEVIIMKVSTNTPPNCKPIYDSFSSHKPKAQMS